MGIGKSKPAKSSGGGKSKAPKEKKPKEPKEPKAPKAPKAPKEPKAPKKKKKARKPRGGKKGPSKYEEEDFLALAPAAFEGVAVQAGLRKPVSKFEDEDYESEEDYEDEDYEEDEYESDGEEGYDWQKYAPADFANVATPTNMSLVLLALLFIMIVLSRR